MRQLCAVRRVPGHPSDEEGTKTENVFELIEWFIQSKPQSEFFPFSPQFRQEVGLRGGALKRFWFLLRLWAKGMQAIFNCAQ
jgi:hypothetical protein